MSIFSSDPGAPGKKSRTNKPRIWTEGRQRARFELRAYLRVSLKHARALASPAAASVAATMGRFAARVTEGRIRVPASRLGRIGQALPSHRDVGAGIDTTARMIAEAARRAAGPEPVAPLTFRGWDGAVVGPVRDPVVTVIAAPPMPPEPPRIADPVAAAPLRPPARKNKPAPAEDPPDEDRATLEAIRSMIHAAEIEPKRPSRPQVPVVPPAPPPPRSAALPDLAPMEQRSPGPLFLASAAGLGHLFVALAWPLGAIKSGWMHLRGVDLRLVE